MKHYECKVKYQKILESGELKLVTENYLVEAVFFTDAETRIYEKLNGYSDLEPVGIKIANYSEIVSESGKWFKVKITFLTMNEETGKYKKSSTYFLVQAENVEQANQFTHKRLNEVVTDYEISSVSETKIIEVLN